MGLKPSSVPTWATDSTYTNGPTGIPTTANKVSPSGAQQAEGYVPQNKLPAQHQNWWQNLVGQWVQYFDGFFDNSDEYIYPDTRTRVLKLSPYHGCSVSATNAGEVFDAWQPNGGFPRGLAAQYDNKRIFYGISDYLPKGATVTLIRAFINAATARSSGSRMYMELFKQVQTYSTPDLTETGLISVQDNGSSGFQIISSGTLSQAVNKGGEILSLEFYSGTSATSNNHDSIYGIEITYTDPGPRNY